MLVEIRAQSAHLTGCQGLHADDVMYHVINGLAHTGNQPHKIIRSYFRPAVYTLRQQDTAELAARFFCVD